MERLFKRRKMKKTLILLLIFLVIITALFWWKLSKPLLIETKKSPPVAENTEKIPPKIYLLSYFMNKEFYEGAYKSVEKNVVKPKEMPQILIVNHHLLAPHFIAQVLHTASSDTIETVFLLSPNHHHRGGKTIFTNISPWKTPFGFLEANTKIIEKSGFSKISNDMIQAEHGISGIVAFIKKSFPNAQVVPLAIDDSATPEDEQKLQKFLSENFSQNSVIIGSMDFSHDLTNDIANFHDELSKAVLQNLDTEGAKRVDNDSRPILKTLINLAKEKGYTSFEILQNSNSSKIIKNPDQSLPTSYITGYFIKSFHKNEKPPAVMSILATGDIMLDRYIRKTIAKKGVEFIIDPFFQRFLSGQDITLVNHEGVMSTQVPNPPKGDMTNFTVDPALSKNLFQYGINMASIANNHTLDFGKIRLEETKKYLESAGIHTIGHPFNTQNISVIQEIRGEKIGFVAYHDLFTHDPEPILKEIKRIRPSVDFIMVYTHWGTEYFTGIPPSQRETAKQFIDAGADMIIGHHPHVIQPMEIYNGKPIFYSLGNFVFDQIFSEEVRTGLTLGIMIKKDIVEVSFFPIYRNANFSARIINGEERRKFLKQYSENSAVDERLKEEIKNGKVKIFRNIQK